MAGLDGEDELTFLRFLWAELQGFDIDIAGVDISIQRIPGLFNTDAKDLFDK